MNQITPPMYLAAENKMNKSTKNGKVTSSIKARLMFGKQT
jgi:hypothetical protein